MYVKVRRPGVFKVVSEAYRVLKDEKKAGSI